MRANVGLEIPNIGRAELESRVESNLATTIARAEAERDTATQSEALAMRADLRIIQKRFEEAEIDCKEALRADPESVKPLLALSHLMGNSKRVEEAIQLLERAYRKGARPEAAFMYARALLQRNGKEDVDAAVSLLTAIKIDDLRSQFRFSVASAAVEAMLRRASYEEANDYLTVVSASLRPEAVDTLRGYIEFAQGENAAAEHFTAQASSKLSSDTGIEIKESLARLFGGLGKFADSLPLLQEIFDLNTQDFEWGRLLDCAARLRRDDVVMKTCAELRRRGQDAWEMVSFEAQYLQKYSRDKAVALLDDFLKSHPGHKLALLSRSVIGVQSRQLALVSGSIDQLPTVEDLPLEYIVAAVHILRFVGAGNDAVDYAYRYLRLHFDDIRAHEALILSLVAGGPSITIPPTQDFAEVGSAVCVFEDSANAVRWFVVEHTDKPNADFEEISSESVLAKELIGKRVGDSVVLAKGQMQSRTGIVRQVIPKYVRRYQDVMAEMQVRFGDKSSIESMHIGTTEEETAKAIEKILDSVKNREAAIAQLRVLYDQMPVSLHMFGARFGENAYVALASLAQEDGQFVKVTFGTPEERTQATFALQAAANVVVDITAVATLRLIGLEILLKSRRFHFQMSEGTFGELQETLVGDLFSSSTSATINHRAGVPAVVEDTADQKAERRARDDEFLKSLKAAVEIVPVLELSDVEPSKREPLEKAFGQYGAESIILAAKSDSILWTDDLIQAEMAKNEFGAKRAWTELIVEQSVMADGLTIEERQQAVAALIGMEYSVTSFDSSTVLKAIEMSDAKSWRTPLKQFVNVFRKPHTNSQGMLGIFVDFTTKLYRESYLPETKCEVTTTFLDAMWENAPLRLTLLLLRKATPQLFGLNPVGQKQFETCFDKWYLDKPDKLIGT
jgi:tetratricopeptide (TPR) repeat protein